MNKPSAKSPKKEKRTIRDLRREAPNKDELYENLLSLADPITINLSESFTVSGFDKISPPKPKKPPRTASLIDRTLAIVGVSYLEYGLELAIGRYLSKDLSEKRREMFFDPDWGPLSEFGARSKMALGLGIIAESQYKDFQKIALIRNEFAHTMKHRNFDEPEIKKECETLNILTTGILKAPIKGWPEEVMTTQKKFLMVISTYFWHLDTHWPEWHVPTTSP